MIRCLAALEILPMFNSGKREHYKEKKKHRRCASKDEGERRNKETSSGPKN
jgi:hypothetical protein